jgi:hypothetical protein
MSCVYTGVEHALQVISRVTAGFPGGDRVVRWCSDCGAIVRDMDIDGRTQPGAEMPMKFPRVALDAAKEPSHGD